jgi:hypothetical protein
VSTIESPKSHKIECLKGKVVDSVEAIPGDDKSSRGRGVGQATPSSEGVAASAQNSNRKRWVAWKDWDAVRAL